MFNSVLRTLSFLAAMFFMAIAPSTFTASAFAAETLTVSFDYSTPGGSYSPKHVVVAWIETSTGTFVKTIGRYAGTRDNDLKDWYGKSGGNDTDAKLGATITTFARRTWVWDLTKRGSTARVANGIYIIKFEVDAGNNADGSVSFDLNNGTARTETPANSGKFTNISLAYTGRTASAPTINTQPSNVTVTAGAGATFSITATGATSYQWQRNNTNISGATSASYTINTTAIADSGTYHCIASNTTGPTTSSDATLTVNAAAPTVTAPTAQSVVAGSTATFSVTATSAVAMTYQWKVSTTGISGTYNNVTGGSGATAASYTTAATATTDNGKYYRCVVTNSANGNLATTSSSALLTVSAAVVAPNITADPVSVIKTVGQTATFSVTATGSPLNYQWKKNGSTNVGTNSSTYSFTCALADDGTSYSCVVSNTAGADTSATANLTVNAPLPLPVITGAATASVYENNAFNYAFTLSGSPTACTASGLPTGLSLTSNATSGAITGTPTVSGVFPVTITATNATGDGTKDIEITVIGKPVITSSTSESVLVNTAFSYTITATNTPTSFTATGLPAELTLTNGVISGTPTSLTTYSVTIRAANAAGNSTAATLSINVNDGSTPPPAAPAEPKKCGYGAGLSTFLLMIMASLSLMISNRRGTKRD